VADSGQAAAQLPPPRRRGAGESHFGCPAKMGQVRHRLTALRHQPEL